MAILPAPIDAVTQRLRPYRVPRSGTLREACPNRYAPNIWIRCAPLKRCGFICVGQVVTVGSSGRGQEASRTLKWRGERG